MSEHQETPPPRPTIKQRMKAVNATVAFNPGVQIDTAVTGSGVASDVLLEKKAPEIIDKLPLPLPHDAKLGILMAASVTLGLFGRPLMEMANAPAESSEETDITSIRDVAKTIYGRSMLPLLAKAWKTGLPQVPEEPTP